MSSSDQPKPSTTSTKIRNFWFPNSFVIVENKWNLFFLWLGDQRLLCFFRKLLFLKRSAISVGSVDNLGRKLWFPLDVYVVSCPTRTKNLERYITTLLLPTRATKLVKVRMVEWMRPDGSKHGQQKCVATYADYALYPYAAGCCYVTWRKGSNTRRASQQCSTARNNIRGRNFVLLC